MYQVRVSSSGNGQYCHCHCSVIALFLGCFDHNEMCLPVVIDIKFIFIGKDPSNSISYMMSRADGGVSK